MRKPDVVYFFGTCLINLLYPRSGPVRHAAACACGHLDLLPPGSNLLWSAGLQSRLPGLGPAWWQPTRLRLACGYSGSGVPSASCVGMFRVHYPQLFADTPDEARAQNLAGRVYEFTGFPMQKLDLRPVDLDPSLAVILHNSYLARHELGATDAARVLLDRLGNIRTLEPGHADECCGLSGTFAVKQPQFSAAIAATGAPTGRPGLRLPHEHGRQLPALREQTAASKTHRQADVRADQWRMSGTPRVGGALGQPANAGRHKARPGPITVAKRQTACPGGDGLECLRDQGQEAFRAHTLVRLPRLLEKLERNRTHSGPLGRNLQPSQPQDTGHPAPAQRADAHQGQIRGLRRVGLNALLEAQSIEIVEIDLGELIVQLVGICPFHILAPAIRKDQCQIAELTLQGKVPGSPLQRRCRGAHGHRPPGPMRGSAANAILVARTTCSVNAEHKASRRPRRMCMTAGCLTTSSTLTLWRQRYRPIMPTAVRRQRRL